MKPTGIVRRIDDLGRVVMPKELRRTLRIREGDPLEIYVSDGSVMLKKYAPSNPEIGDYASDYAKTLAEVTGCIALVADKDSFVSVSGAPQREYIDKPIPENWTDEIQKANSGIFDDVDEDTGIKRVVAYSNVVYDEKKAGLVVLMTKGNASVGDLELKLVETAADFIAKRMKG